MGLWKTYPSSSLPSHQLPFYPLSIRCFDSTSEVPPPSTLQPSLSSALSPWVSGKGGGPRYPPTPGCHRAARGWWGSDRVSPGKMAALASSLIRQRREVKDPQQNRQIASKRKPCPKSNKSLCQKQILILISKVRLCGSRGRKMEKRPGEFLEQTSLSIPLSNLSTLTSSLHCVFIGLLSGFWFQSLTGQSTAQSSSTKINK